MNISILVPTKDMNHHLPDLLKNLDTQVIEGDEVLILFDGTEIDPATAALLKRYPYVKAFQTKTAKGVSTARNFLAKNAQHDVLRFQDADDLLAPYALENARRIIAELSDWHVLTGGQISFGNHQFNRVVGHPHNVDLPAKLMIENPLLVNMCFFHKRSFMAVGGFDPKIEFQEDWDLWLRYLKAFGKSAFTVTQQLFGIYNIYPTERSAKQRQKTIDGMDSREYFFRKSGFTPPKPM